MAGPGTIATTKTRLVLDTELIRLMWVQLWAFRQLASGGVMYHAIDGNISAIYPLNRSRGSVLIVSLV